MSESKRPRQGGSGPDRRRGRPDQRPERRNGGKPTARSSQGGGTSRDDRRAPRRDDRRDDVPTRTEDQKIYDGPPIPDDISAKDLDKQARLALQSIPEKLAERVVSPSRDGRAPDAGRPRDRLPARPRSTRSSLPQRPHPRGLRRDGLRGRQVRRGPVGVPGRPPHERAPVLRADDGRLRTRPRPSGEGAGLRHPEICGRSSTTPARSSCPSSWPARVATLARSKRPLRLLETEPLHSKSRAEWVARLRYAYADALLDAGRREDAIEWFHRVVAVDGNKATDAEERLATLG